MAMDSITIRKAEPRDAEAMLAFILEHAVIEGETNGVPASAEGIRRELAKGEASVLVALVAEEAGGALAGMMMGNRMFSSWLTAPYFFMDDLFVTEAHRRSGLGSRLLAATAALCVEHGIDRLDWSVGAENARAASFYATFGADELPWRAFRLDGAKLAAAAARAAL